MVEGGTLLRCYTSQRGIEGSNPSSSAPKVPRLQDERKGEEGAGGEPGPYYTNGASVTGYLYPWPRHLVIALSIQRGLVQPKSVALSACSHAGCWIWTSENGPYSIT